MATMIYQAIVDGEVWHGKIKNRTGDGSCYWVNTIFARILNLGGKTRRYLPICPDTPEGLPPLSPAFRSFSMTYSRAASRDLGWHLGAEPKSSSHFESIRASSLALLFGMDYAT
jgi:hypothetical protein